MFALPFFSFIFGFFFRDVHVHGFAAERCGLQRNACESSFLASRSLNSHFSLFILAATTNDTMNVKKDFAQKRRRKKVGEHKFSYLAFLSQQNLHFSFDYCCLLHSLPYHNFNNRSLRVIFHSFHTSYLSFFLCAYSLLFFSPLTLFTLLPKAVLQ